MGTPGNIVDLRQNFMSCCGIGGFTPQGASLITFDFILNNVRWAPAGGFVCGGVYMRMPVMRAYLLQPPRHSCMHIMTRLLLRPLITSARTAAPAAALSYAGYNLSLPRLPRGLAFSSQLRPVSLRPGQPLLGLGNTSYRGLRQALRHFACIILLSLHIYFLSFLRARPEHVVLRLMMHAGAHTSGLRQIRICPPIFWSGSSTPSTTSSRAVCAAP